MYDMSCNLDLSKFLWQKIAAKNPNWLKSARDTPRAMCFLLYFVTDSNRAKNCRGNKLCSIWVTDGSRHRLPLRIEKGLKNTLATQSAFVIHYV